LSRSIFSSPRCAETSRSAIRFASSHLAYGRRLANSFLISSSGTRRPRSKSIRNMRPGSRRPFAFTFAGLIGTTPTSLAMITRSSFVR
jgi:hypothetical protein